jgi:predicted DCC family thiol-disulfide oxidoreductase YuxK
VQWLRARDHAGRVSALPNQLPRLAERFGLSDADVDRTVWTVDSEGRKLSGAAAVNAALSRLGGVWRGIAAAGGLPVVSWAEERGYDWVAANRGWLSRLWGTTPECERPGTGCR